jgi:predicted Fe-Mo cluster-binding NifX family protein
MKICIPTENNLGLKSKVYGHFGSAPYFTVYDSDGKICDVIANINEHHSHGTCHPLAVLGDKINVVICLGMGARAVMSLNDSGIKVFKAKGNTVEDVLINFERNDCEEITVAKSCNQHHSCH